MERVTEDSLLIQALSNTHISNINNRFNNYIESLKTMFITSNKQQYLETWFNFFKDDFFVKDLEE